MHALMTAILLGMARLDSFDADTEPQPPDRQFAQMEQSVSGSEGHTVIAAHVGGQAALLKKPFKHGESVVFFGGREGFTGEQITAGVIGDGQRVAVLPIAQQELSLVIGAPQLIGSLAQRQGSSLSTTTQATAARDQTVSIQDRMDGALGRNLDVRESPDQALANFPSAPAGVLPLHVQDEGLPLQRQLIGIAIGTTASVGQSFDPAILVAIKDLVAGLAGDAELPAKSRQWLAGSAGGR